jgi:hypothetical protein
MSSKSAREKAKEPRDGGGAVAPTNCKALSEGQKSTHAEEHQPTSLLLQAQPEFLERSIPF